MPKNKGLGSGKKEHKEVAKSTKEWQRAQRSGKELKGVAKTKGVVGDHLDLVDATSHQG